MVPPLTVSSAPTMFENLSEARDVATSVISSRCGEAAKVNHAERCCQGPPCGRPVAARAFGELAEREADALPVIGLGDRIQEGVHYLAQVLSTWPTPSSVWGECKRTGSIRAGRLVPWSPLPVCQHGEGACDANCRDLVRRRSPGCPRCGQVVEFRFSN